jgi:hypothetical protein
LLFFPEYVDLPLAFDAESAVPCSWLNRQMLPRVHFPCWNAKQGRVSEDILFSVLLDGQCTGGSTVLILFSVLLDGQCTGGSTVLAGDDCGGEKLVIGEQKIMQKRSEKSKTT